jgi:hypothetical protein
MVARSILHELMVSIIRDHDRALAGAKPCALSPEVQRAIGMQNVTTPGGQVDTGPEQLTLRIHGRAESPDEFDRIAVDEKNLYIIGVKGIYRVSKDGGRPALLVEQQLDSSNLAVDATNIYWTNYFGGTVMRLRK